MKIILSPDDKKTLKLFSLYIQSHSLTKKAYIQMYYDGDGNFDWQDQMYSDDGNIEIKLYPKIEKLIDSIVEQLDWGYMLEGYRDVQSTNITFEFDTTDNTIEIYWTHRIYDVDNHTSEDELPDLAKNIVDTLSDRCDIVTIDFSGGGDSGYIENTVNCKGKSYNNLINSEFEGFLYDMLSNYGGWEINEGSQGTFEINFKENSITLEIGMNTEVDFKSEKRIVINY
jgi:hypothetical protein